MGVFGLFSGQAANKSSLIAPEAALPGRPNPIATAERHVVLGTALKAPLSTSQQEALFGCGCFWGAEKGFWRLPGVVTTAVGYAGGETPNPTYQETCTGRTGHTEIVLVVYDPARVSYEALLKVFWENHDPTQGMRQGGDIGTQYRSAVYASDEVQMAAAAATRDRYQDALARAGRGTITTEIRMAPTFYYAEEYHQQYLAKNPGGYCGLGGTGVSCPVGVGLSAD